MKNACKIVIGLLLLTGIISAESDSSIVKLVNKTVAALDDSINRGEFKNLRIEEISDVEGSPAMLQFFFKSDNLIAVVVTGGHESWTSEYRYYYYPNEMPMKYLYTIHGRPDDPPRSAVIYDDKGKIVWSNTDTKVKPFTLIEFFKSLRNMQLKFSSY